jgi:cytolysin-activating lysine-acyltransferase
VLLGGEPRFHRSCLHRRIFTNADPIMSARQHVNVFKCDPTSTFGLPRGDACISMRNSQSEIRRSQKHRPPAERCAGTTACANFEKRDGFLSAIENSHELAGQAAAHPNGAAEQIQTLPVDAVLGQVVWLMLQMPASRHFFLADLEWMVLPPILLNQYRLFRNGNRVVAFAAWGYLSEEAEARLQQPNPRLSPADWKSGDRLWLVQMFAPFGHTEAALKDLQATSLAGKGFNLHRISAEGTRTTQHIGLSTSH